MDRIHTVNANRPSHVFAPHSRRVLQVLAPFVLIALLVPIQALAQNPSFTCATSPAGQVYCDYKGPVRLTYVNVYGTILLYPDLAISSPVIQSAVEASGYETYWGKDVNQFFAFAVTIPAAGLETSDPNLFHLESEFANKAYALALAAQLSERNVNLQMRDVHGGLIKVDRIWLE